MDDFQHGRNETPLPPNVDHFTWKSKVKDILPGEWLLMDEWATEKADFVDILSHRSGLPRSAFHVCRTESPEIQYTDLY